MSLKGLNITFEKKIKVRKESIHKIVNIVKNELNKRIDALEINFVGTETIYSINSKYLGHKYVTDVISFDYSNENNSFDGEIFICVEEAENNCKRFNVFFDDEIKRLVIHGLLHFSGFNDLTTAQRRKMKNAEDQLLKLVKTIKVF